MPDGPTKDALDKALAFVGGTGGLAAIGVFVRGFFSGASGQEKEVREGLAERVAALESKVESLEKRLETAHRLRDSWRYLCLQSRLEAERLGFDRSKWPEDPKEEH